MIGIIQPSNFANVSIETLQALATNPQISNLIYTQNDDGTFDGTFDWWFFTDDDITAAILDCLDGLDSSISNSAKATILTAMLRDGGVLK